jgi:membrane protein DedA with SNARE-associated domain
MRDRRRSAIGKGCSYASETQGAWGQLGFSKIVLASGFIASGGILPGEILLLLRRMACVNGQLSPAAGLRVCAVGNECFAYGPGPIPGV